MIIHHITLALIFFYAFCNGEYCYNNEYINGNWVLKQQPFEKAFQCCATDYYNHIHGHPPNETICGPIQFKTHNMYAAFYSGSNEYYSYFGTWACMCDTLIQHELGISDGSQVITDREKYEWKAESCELPQWDAKKFCEILGNRTILMIGDSTMQQTASTLMSMIAHGKGGCAHQIFQGTTYFFVYNLKGASKWTKYYEEVLPDICIINFGAHFHDTGDMFSTWETFKGQFYEIRAKSNHTKFVWKTYNSPHLNCGKRPLPDYEWKRVYQGDMTDLYSWWVFPQFEEMSSNYTKLFNFTTTIDMFPLVYRPDSHASNALSEKYGKLRNFDCLHYCTPGPLDLFSRILLNKLLVNEL